MNKLHHFGEPSPYQLSEQENTRIFEKRIVPELFEDVPSHNRPVLTVLIAQHGAGKTSLVEQSIKPKLQEIGGYVDIDSDVFKGFHPAYDELMAGDDKAMAAHTAIDGQRWMRQAFQYARDHRQHTLVQETVQNPPFLVDMIGTYRAENFEIDITAMGVAEAVSRQAIIKRYHEQRRANGAGRLPAAEKVQASLNGILEFADATDEHKLAHRTSVFRRGSLDPAYINSIAEGKWLRTPSFRQAIESERVRPLTQPEAKDFRLTHKYLTYALGKEWAFELHAIQSLASHILRCPDDELTA